MVLMLERFVYLAISLALVCAIAGSVQAAQIAGSEYRITSYISDQIDPAVYGDNIVYSDSGYLCNYRIQVRKENLTTLLVGGPFDIYGSRIVWWDNNHINELDLTSGEHVRIANSDSVLRKPAIFGDRFYWPAGISYSRTQLNQFDLTTNQQTTLMTSPSYAYLDRIRAYGDKLVYPRVQAQNGNDFLWDIVLWDMTRLAEIPVCTNTSNQQNPAIYGDQVIWQDERNGNWDIYSMNIQDASVRQITNNSSQQINPEISEDKIIWQDNRNGNWDIYLFDLTSRQEYQVTSNAADQINPRLHNNRIVWQDNRNGNWDIYLFEIDSDGTVISVPAGQGPPRDLNNDGYYEDVNGNSRADFADIVLFFNEMAWIAANEPVSAFDYNGNKRIDFADVVWLFNHL